MKRTLCLLLAALLCLSVLTGCAAKKPVSAPAETSPVPASAPAEEKKEEAAPIEEAQEAPAPGEEEAPEETTHRCAGGSVGPDPL